VAAPTKLRHSAVFQIFIFFASSGQGTASGWLAKQEKHRHSGFASE
jgi:hypothetical protein